MPSDLVVWDKLIDAGTPTPRCGAIAPEGDTPQSRRMSRPQRERLGGKLAVDQPGRWWCTVASHFVRPSQRACRRCDRHQGSVRQQMANYLLVR